MPTNSKKPVHIIHRYGGGIDGRDTSDKGGPCAAHFYEDEAQQELKNVWGGGTIETELVDIPKAWNALREKLSPVDLLLLRTYMDTSAREALEAEIGRKLKALDSGYARIKASDR